MDYTKNKRSALIYNTQDIIKYENVFYDNSLRKIVY